MMLVSYQELDRFEYALRQFMQGDLDFEEFRKIRVWQGVYSFRGTQDQYMIRIKIPQGNVSPTQLYRVADLAERYSQNARIHITTRQDLELYGVKQDKIMHVLHGLADVGLTTRETGGNGVRNVTACPFSGIAPDEPFDVTPFAALVTQYFARHPLTQHLPRKIKIAFEGCRQDHIRAMIHDIGVFAAMEKNVKGFHIYAGGGLGGAPRQAQLLEAFTPEDQLLPSIEAILIVFDRHGSRQTRDRARLKYLVQDWGMEKFRKEVFAERGSLLAKSKPWPPAEIPEEEFVALNVMGDRQPEPHDPAFERWLDHSVIDQKQDGFCAVFIRCALGDITADDLKRAACVAQSFCQGFIRTTITQNLLLRWVHRKDAACVYKALGPDLVRCCAERIMDITRCAGADSCLSAITYSRGMAIEIEKIFSNGLGRKPEISKLSIKLSGCPHACGQHPVADIGLHGASKTIHGRQVPHYQLLVGGHTREGQTQFARPVLMFPAKKAHRAVERLLQFYLDAGNPGESFRDFIAHAGLEQIRQELRPLTHVPPYNENPDIYKDWGSHDDYRVNAKRGECSA